MGITISVYRRRYWVKRKDGRRVKRLAKLYTIQYRGSNGKLVRATGYESKRASQAKAGKIRDALERGEQDLSDKYADHRGTPLSLHIDGYAADLRGLGRDDGYVYNVERRLKILAKDCNWSVLGDVESKSFIQWRGRERKLHVRPGRLAEGASATTLNQYLETVRAFTNWCARMHLIPGFKVGSRTFSSVFGDVENSTGEERRKRRALTDEQVQSLLAVAGDRAIVYRVGLSIGLRRGELEQLQWGDLHLEAIRPYAKLRAEATKARRGDRLDLPVSLAADLRQHRPTTARDNDRVFTSVPTIEAWKADLDTVGIPYKDQMGRQADFHGGTRKTMCSRMHRAGVPLAVAMRRMRHTDSKLTMVDYVDDEQIGMEAGTLPELPTVPGPAQVVATGD
jgi:integrase